ncbi:hypothetical protein Dip510_000889 [Elusimicrobium posterum]|uniref:hypothetical protein n=1 Tax=Elusimicrobium posterum TaxID=3116653 RepID=UPI003C73B4C7
MKTKRLLIYFLFVCAFSALSSNAAELNFSATADFMAGYASDLDFRKDTSQNRYYSGQRVKPKLDLIFSDRYAIITEFQFTNTDGTSASPYSSFSTNDNNFKILDSYLKIVSKEGRSLKFGYQNVELPSFTFGNPFFNGHTFALTTNGPIGENTDLDFIVAHPIKTEDNMPDGGTTTMFGVVLDTRSDSARFKPYLTYTTIDHNVNSPYEWASAPDDEYTYITAGGFAAELYASDKTTIKMDMVYGDSNNPGPHHYEAKGGLSAILIEHKTKYGIPGIFAWQGSGNDTKLQVHQDYGTLPSVAFERSFAPTRMAFKGSDTMGRDAYLTATGAGTAGVGFHIRDLSFVDNITHVLRAAYIVGTSEKQGAARRLQPPYPALQERAARAP